MTLQVQVVKLSNDAKLPEYGTDGAGCFDIYAYLGKGQEQLVRNTAIINTGLAFEIPEGHVMLVYSRSGHGFKKNMRLANCVAVIDSDYRGELLIKLSRDHLDQNNSQNNEYISIKHGEAIAQAMIVPYPKVEFLEVNELTATERGENGFGSTDIKNTTAQFNWGCTKDQQGN